MKKTIRDSMGNLMTINFPGKIESTPNSLPVELPIFKCSVCNLPMLPSKPTYGGRGYEQVCINPECVNNPDSKAYEQWLKNRSKKRSQDHGLEIRDGVWHIMDGGL